VVELAFTLITGGATTQLSVPIRQAVIAGWTGRDPVARDHHIAELEALGVARPATTPIYYRVAAARLTTATTIEVSGAESSGEVEFVLIGAGGRILTSAGSDHTDRKVETYGVTVSKQMCDKPVAPDVWDFAELENHWDRIVLRSFATIDGEREPYQEGTLAAMLPPRELIARGFGTDGLPDGCALFGGTLAAKGGVRAASRFDFEMHDPVLERTIRHGYDVIELPVLG
jgi:hypothetical protein